MDVGLVEGEGVVGYGVVIEGCVEVWVSDVLQFCVSVAAVPLVLFELGWLWLRALGCFPPWSGVVLSACVWWEHTYYVGAWGPGLVLVRVRLLVSFVLVLWVLWWVMWLVS